MFQNKKQPLFKNREIYVRKKLKVIHVCFVNYFLPETSLGEAVFCSFSFFDCLLYCTICLLRTSSILHRIFGFLFPRNLCRSEQTSIQLIVPHNYRMYCPTKAHSVLPCCCRCVTDRGMYCLCVYVVCLLPGPGSPPVNSPPVLA